MRQSGLEVQREHLVKLAAMECFASCVMSYVSFIDRGFHRLMQDYWNINYQFKTLLSSKDARQMSLDFHYGITMKFKRGKQEDLQQDLLSGKCAILLCSASKLTYFPENMLGLERSGFQHCIFIRDWDFYTDSYQIADPMVEYIGRAGKDEVERAGIRNDRRKELIYFTLDAPSGTYRPPSPQRLFSYCTERNLMYFDQRLIQRLRFSSRTDGNDSESSKHLTWTEWFSNRNSGSKSFDLFIQDLIASQEWSHLEKNRWIERNNLTITSIWKIRSQVWGSFCDLQVMTDEQKEEGSSYVRHLIRLWQSFNFHMSKYKKLSVPLSGQMKTIASIVEKIQSEERDFLLWMNDLGEKVHGEADAYAALS